VAVAPGANTITVQASDAQGNTTQAQLAVSYAVPLAPCQVPKVVGLTRTGARKRLVAAGCKLGAVSTKYYKPRHVRKGRRQITISYRKGRVVTQRVKAGAKVAHGTAVRVTLQGSKPKAKKH
jgi:beta-lactam-binding protein with PASTA domain